MCVCIVADSSLDWLIKVGYGQFKVSFIPLTITLSHDYDSCNFQLNKKKACEPIHYSGEQSLHSVAVDRNLSSNDLQNVHRRRCSQLYVCA